MINITRILTLCRCIIALLIIPFYSAYAEQTSQKLQLDLSAEFLIAGDIDIDDDVLAGAELSYFFYEINQTPVFLSVGVRTDVDNEGVAVDIYNIDIGSQYTLGKLFGKKTFLEYSFGATYTRQEYSISLIDREANNTFSEVGAKASLELGLALSRQFSTKLFFNQYSDTTTTGLGLSYSF